MSEDKEFKSITIAFKKSNEDVRQKIMKLVEDTGESKVNIVCEAVRQYDPYKDKYKNSDVIDKDMIKQIVQETIVSLMLNNQLIQFNQLNKQQNENTMTIEEVEKDKLKSLNSKVLNENFLEDEGE